jgi:hypothetical protein
VLREIGLDDGEIAALEAEGVITDRPQNLPRIG